VTYQPEYYDVVIPPSFQGDVEWYCRQAIRAGGPVLELGCGTGRVTIPMAATGARVHALDSDAAMLARLQARLATQPADVQKRISTSVGDMRTFELSQQFALVVAPFRAFLHNVTEADQVACLRQIRRHLIPGGRFAFNVFHPSLEYMAHHAGAFAGVWRWVATYPLASGGFLVRSEANRYDTIRQVVHSHHKYEEFGSDGVLTTTAIHRLDLAYLYAGDIRRLLAQAGFVDVTIAGGFDGRAELRDTDELVVEAVSPGG